MTVVVLRRSLEKKRSNANRSGAKEPGCDKMIISTKCCNIKCVEHFVNSLFFYIRLPPALISFPSISCVPVLKSPKYP